MASAFRGTTAEQDSRFSDKQAKLMQSLHFPSIYTDHPIKVSTVRQFSEAVEQFVSTQLAKINGFEDDVLSSLVMNLLTHHDAGEGVTGDYVDAKTLHIQLVGFVNQQKTTEFMTDLWGMLIELQTGKPVKPDMITTQPVVIPDQITLQQAPPSVTPIAQQYGLNGNTTMHTNGHSDVTATVTADKSGVTDVKPDTSLAPLPVNSQPINVTHRQRRQRRDNQSSANKQAELVERLYGKRQSRRTRSPSYSPPRRRRSRSRSNSFDRRYDDRYYSPQSYSRSSRYSSRRDSRSQRYLRSRSRSTSRDRYDRRLRRYSRSRSRSVSRERYRSPPRQHSRRYRSPSPLRSRSPSYGRRRRAEQPDYRATHQEERKTIDHTDEQPPAVVDVAAKPHAIVATVADPTPAPAEATTSLPPLPAHVTSGSTESSLEALEALRKRALANLKARRASQSGQQQQSGQASTSSMASSTAAQ